MAEIVAILNSFDLSEILIPYVPGFGIENKAQIPTLASGSQW